MFKTAILDLQCGNSTTSGSYRVFCSIYIQFSCLLFLNDIQLLQTIRLKDNNNKPNFCLQQSTTELDILSRNTVDF